jgi:hypothetical protein
MLQEGIGIDEYGCSSLEENKFLEIKKANGHWLLIPASSDSY